MSLIKSFLESINIIGKKTNKELIKDTKEALNVIKLMNDNKKETKEEQIQVIIFLHLLRNYLKQ
jgi:hypothetical protein